MRTSAQTTYGFDQIKTKTVEHLVFQLIHEVTSITETFPLKKGESAEGLVVAVQQTVESFSRIGAAAINECPIAKGEDKRRLQDALYAVEMSGEKMLELGRAFVRDSTNSQKRMATVNAARLLLQSVFHFNLHRDDESKWTPWAAGPIGHIVDIATLLILADQIDVLFMVHEVLQARRVLEDLRKSENNDQVEERYQALQAQVEVIEETIRRRVNDLRDPSEREDLMAARALLKTSCPLVFSTTKAFVRHPESSEAKLNCDFAHEEADKALMTIENVLQGRQPLPVSISSLGEPGSLVAELDQFQSRAYMEPSAYKKHLHRPELEELLERIVSGAASIADSGSTRPKRKQDIVTECNNLRQALQDLLGEYEKNCGRSETTEDVDLAMVLVGRRAKDLRRHVRRAIVDHVSDAFLDTHTPLDVLIRAAQSKDMEQTNMAAENFRLHAKALVDVALLSCMMCSDAEGLRVIRYTAYQLDALAPQVVNAARLLCVRGESKVAERNMTNFKNYWLEKVRLLTMALDSVVSIDDFLAVTEQHIAEDATTGLEALMRDRDSDMLDRAAGAIRGRSLRVCEAVDAEMEGVEPSVYVEDVKKATKVLREKTPGSALDEFTLKAEGTITRLADLNEKDLPMTAEFQNGESQEFIDACSLVHTAVKDIRHALLKNRNLDDVDSDEEYDEDRQTHHDTASKISEGENQQKVMRRLPEEDRRKIQEQIDVFKITQTKFEREVAKWDETGNDLIVLAKKMCMIMMDMTDFTRGRGPLKTTMDVIRAAQEISHAGASLKALATQIGEESADSYTKEELKAYLSKIPTYCQQLNICSKVKADVQQVGNDLVVSGLDSAMSLIQTAKNLLMAVVATVRTAYIASTKVRRGGPDSSSRFEWRMAPPKKQPLVRAPQKAQVIRRASERRPLRPAQFMAEFIPAV